MYRVAEAESATLPHELSLSVGWDVFDTLRVFVPVGGLSSAEGQTDVWCVRIRLGQR